MVGMLKSSTLYVLGRNPSRYQNKFDELKSIGPTNKIVLNETQVDLISQFNEACKQISAAESKVHVTCVSPGGIPFQDTEEGLKSCFLVFYYSRLRLIFNLLPLIHSSPSPCVLSILNGIKEKRANETDIGLDKSKAWGLVAVVNYTSSCTNLTFDYLAANDDKKHVRFLHGNPGSANTDTPRTTFPSSKHGLIRWALVSTIQVVSGWIIRWFGVSAKEAGQSHAYLLTSDQIVLGSWQVDIFSDIAECNEILKTYQEHKWDGVIWEFTRNTWEGVLSKGVTV